MVKLPRLRKRGTRYYFDHGGKPRRWEALGSVESVALKRYRALMETPKPTPGTVDQMLAEVIDDLRGKVKPGTLANYRGFRKHLAAVFKMPPEDVDQAHIRQYLNACPRKSFRGEIALLSMAYALWMDQGRLRFNPCYGVTVKRKGSKRTRLLTWNEIDLIVAKADERLAVAIELACALGLRISDCCALRWAATYTDTGKTGRRLAWEPSADLDAILARARALQARVASLYVLCNRRGKRWLTGTLRDRWDAATEAAGVPDAHFHDLRAAAATEIEKRQGREAAQHFLGHKSSSTTEVYLRDKRVTTVRPLARKTSTR